MPLQLRCTRALHRCTHVTPTQASSHDTTWISTLLGTFAMHGSFHPFIKRIKCGKNNPPKSSTSRSYHSLHLFSGIYSYSPDVSVQAPDPYSENGQFSDNRQCAARRVSMCITRTLDFEDSDTLDALLNGKSCHKSMHGKMQSGIMWEKWPTSQIRQVPEAIRSSPSFCLGRSAPLHRKFLTPSSVAPSVSAHHAARWWSSPHRSRFSCLPSESRSKF